MGVGEATDKKLFAVKIKQVICANLHWISFSMNTFDSMTCFAFWEPNNEAFPEKRLVYWHYV